MDFRTELKLTKSNVDINHQSKILMIGSCFSDKIGSHLQAAGINVQVNPFGTVFNSHSIHVQISKLIGRQKFTEILFDRNNHENFAFHYDVHSVFNHPEKEMVLQRLEKVIADFHTDLKPVTHCFITLGTSWVYEHLGTNKMVANCHKMPQQLFAKRLLSVDQNTKLLSGTVDQLTAVYPNIKIIFTVSPVRHIKDGIVENSRSKAILLESIHQLTQTNVFYFPAYELMMDDLRDYRFYANDLIHPSSFAISYIWEKFSSVYFNTQTIELIKKHENLSQLKNHRLMASDPLKISKHQQNIEQLEQELKGLQSSVSD